MSKLLWCWIKWTHVLGKLWRWRTGIPTLLTLFRLYNNEVCLEKRALCSHIWAATWQNQQNESAPSEDSDQPGHPPSLIKVFAVRSMGSPVWSESSLCAQWVAKDPSFLHADSQDSDQIGRMPRLIWVFAGRTLILLAHSFCWFCHVEAHMVLAHLSIIKPTWAQCSTESTRLYPMLYV